MLKFCLFSFITLLISVSQILAADDAVKILPLGDSITQGGNNYASYRRSLWFKLQNQGYDIDFIGSQSSFVGDVDEALKDFDLDHQGHWAQEAGWLDDNLDVWLINYTPDIVLLHAGTNDFYRGQSNSSTIDELDSIINNKFRAKNANVVILLAKIIPMKNTDTFSFNQFIESLAISKSTADSPVILVDQYTGYNPQTDNHDNWHPNTTGEEKMASRWFAALQPFLEITPDPDNTAASQLTPIMQNLLFD